jgi:hypothetical protein
MDVGVGQRMKLAVQASVDLRTISKALKGLPIKGRAGERARAVLSAAGLLPVAPAKESEGASR